MTPYADVSEPPCPVPRAAPITLAIAAVAILALAAAHELDADATVTWVRDAGPAGVLALAFAYVAASVAALPVAAVSMAAGWAYGVGWGMAIIVPVALTASLAGFGVGRTFLRGRIEERVRRDRRFEAIDRAIGAEGFRITLLMRLTPILPFGILNYALSATSVRPSTYAVATVIGVAPATLMYVYLGSLAGGASAAPGISGAATWCGLALTALAVIVIARTARRALDGASERAS